MFDLTRRQASRSVTSGGLGTDQATGPMPPCSPTLRIRPLIDLTDHIHSHNDYPYGTMQLGVGLLEKPVTVKKLNADTYNWKRTAAKVGPGSPR